jgi:hypothetical protein
MRTCINCDHPDLCHDLTLKICYRVDSAHRCACVQFTEWPEEAPPEPININPLNIPIPNQDDITNAMMKLVGQLTNQNKLTE